MVVRCYCSSATAVAAPSVGSLLYTQYKLVCLRPFLMFVVAGSSVAEELIYVVGNLYCLCGQKNCIVCVGSLVHTQFKLICVRRILVSM